MASGNGISGLLNFKIFGGGGSMPPDPPRDWRLRRASGLPPHTNFYGYAMKVRTWGADSNLCFLLVYSGWWTIWGKAEQRHGGGLWVCHEQCPNLAKDHAHWCTLKRTVPGHCTGATSQYSKWPYSELHKFSLPIMSEHWDKTLQRSSYFKADLWRCWCGPEQTVNHKLWNRHNCMCSVSCRCSCWKGGYTSVWWLLGRVGSQSNTRDDNYRRWQVNEHSFLQHDFAGSWFPQQTCIVIRIYWLLVEP